MNDINRYKETSKSTLWEKDQYDGGIYLGTYGIYRSSSDGKYFYAHYYSNDIRYTGESVLLLISEADAKVAVNHKVYFDPCSEDYVIDPIDYLTKKGYDVMELAPGVN